MDDGIAAGKCREHLRPQQAMGIGNRANGSHYARSDYKRSHVRRQAILNERMFFGSFVPTVSHLAADRQQRQSLQERPDAGLKYRIARRCGDEHADPPHPLALLRARRERPCGHPEQRDELAPFQLIELHAVPTSQGRIIGYRIGEDQSGGNETISQSVGRSLSSRWYCSILFSTENLLATCKFDRCSNLASKLRSEERRVGKECSKRGTTAHK